MPVPDSELGDLEGAVGVAHCAKQLTDSDGPSRFFCTRDASLDSALNRVNGVIERQARHPVELRCPSNLGVHNSVRNEVIDKLACDSFEVCGCLHDRQCHLKSCQVVGQRTGIRLRPEPLTESASVIGGQVNASVRCQVNDCLRTYATIEVVVERDLGKHLNDDVGSGKDVLASLARGNLG